MINVDSSQYFIEQKRLADCAFLLAQTTTSAAFVEAVLTVLERYLDVDHFSVLAGTPTVPVRLVAAGSHKRDGVSSAIAHIYVLRFLHADPVPQAIAAVRQPQRLLIRNLHAGEVSDPIYRYECYDKPGITERLTIGNVEGGTWHVLNLYRNRRSGPFGEADVMQALPAAVCILGALPVLSAVTDDESTSSNHGRLAWFIKRLRALPAHLTTREVEVCARALLGMTVEGTALDLGIACTSVATYRKRAYQRLGISSQNELFAAVC
jgi:DNA-binding CsgD family transcriptional regulator